jgi:uncharacterized membrane protein
MGKLMKSVRFPIGILLATMVLLIVRSLITGVAYWRSGEVLRVDDPQGFWFLVAGYSFCVLIVFFAFFFLHDPDDAAD